MSVRSLDVIIVSQRSLIRVLLGELLRTRGAALGILRCASLDEGLSCVRGARVLVCDVQGFGAAALAAFMARMRAEWPAVRVVTIDDSLGVPDLDEVVKAARAADSSTPLPHESLTPLESEVMLAVATGLRNDDIARHMRRSPKTVEKHRANALRKLGFRNVAQLTAYAIRHGLLDADGILDADGARPGNRDKRMGSDPT